MGNVVFRLGEDGDVYMMMISLQYVFSSSADTQVLLKRKLYYEETKLN